MSATNFATAAQPRTASLLLKILSALGRSETVDARQPRIAVRTPGDRPWKETFAFPAYSGLHDIV